MISKQRDLFASNWLSNKHQSISRNDRKEGSPFHSILHPSRNASRDNLRATITSQFTPAKTFKYATEESKNKQWMKDAFLKKLLKPADKAIPITANAVARKLKTNAGTPFESNRNSVKRHQFTKSNVFEPNTNSMEQLGFQSSEKKQVFTVELLRPKEAKKSNYFAETVQRTEFHTPQPRKSPLTKPPESLVGSINHISRMLLESPYLWQSKRV